MATLTVKDTEVPGSVDYTWTPKDAKGETAKVDGFPEMSADGGAVDSVGEVKANDDGSFTATLHITDKPSASNITTKADADLGEGVVEITTVDVVSVIPGDAVAGEGSFGPVTPDAPAPSA